MASKFGGVLLEGGDPSPIQTESPRGMSGYTREDVLAELQRRGSLPPEYQPRPQDDRSQIYQEMAADVGPLQAFLIGTGKGFADVARGIGVMEEGTKEEYGAMSALREQRPVSTISGEILGQAAPFIPIGGMASSGLKIASGGRQLIPEAGSLLSRVVRGGGAGAAEGATISAGMQEDAHTGGILGGAAGAGAEIVFPLIGRAGMRLYQRTFGRAPRGAMLDTLGRPTQEFKAALDASGMSFEDLSRDAVEAVSQMQTGTVPEQAVRAARFRTEGIPATRGEITGSQAQLATEQRLLGSTTDEAANMFREFKLQQSEAIRENLERAVGEQFTKEDAGTLMIDALSGRKSLLRTQKNDLYRLAKSKSEDIGGLPLFVDDIKSSVPDPADFEDLAITSPQAMESVNKILSKYGIIDPTPEMIKSGFKPTPLTIENVERFRKTLNMIERGDQTGASSVAIGPIREALDKELVEMSESTGAVLARAGGGKAGVKRIGTSPAEQRVEDIRGLTKTLQDARETVKTLKTEFDPAELVGKLTRPKRAGGVTPMVEASKAYDTLMSKAQPVEQVRSVVKSLGSAGEEGKKAIGAIQATTMLDLIESGFSTPSRKIEGVPLFNPVAFNRRLKNIGQDKVDAIFKDRPDIIKKIKNIEKISADLIPPEKAVPKGTSDTLLDVLGAMGITSIVGNIPVVGTIARGTSGAVREASQRAATRAQVREALNASPEIQELIGRSFPALQGALQGAAESGAVAGTLEYQRQGE